MPSGELAVQVKKNRLLRRSGYALMMCLMVVAVTSSIVLTLFHSIRLQTAESLARRQIVVKNSLADAAFEHALATLIDNPNFSGTLNFAVPNERNRGYTLAVQPVSGDHQITAVLRVAATNTTVSRLITAKQLDQRRKTLGL